MAKPEITQYLPLRSRKPKLFGETIHAVYRIRAASASVERERRSNGVLQFPRLGLVSLRTARTDVSRYDESRSRPMSG